MGQGGAGGALSTVQTYSGSTGFCAAATYSQSDLQHFQVWVGTLAAGSGSTVRPLTGYIDGSALGWQNRWTGCGSFVQGSVNSANPVTIGSSLYNGDILEIIVWKGVALRFDLLITRHMYRECYETLFGAVKLMLTSFKRTLRTSIFVRHLAVLFPTTTCVSRFISYACHDCL